MVQNPSHGSGAQRETRPSRVRHVWDTGRGTDAAGAGGLSEVQKIAALSSAFHIPYAPHTGSCSAVALHIATALPHFLIYEYMQNDWSKEQPNPLRHDLSIGRIKAIFAALAASPVPSGCPPQRRAARRSTV